MISLNRSQILLIFNMYYKLAELTKTLFLLFYNILLYLSKKFDVFISPKTAILKNICIFVKN